MQPAPIIEYFENKGYKVVIRYHPYGLDLFSTTADACILYYEFDTEPIPFGNSTIHNWGAHFIFYEKTADGYMGYNVFTNKALEPFNDVSSFLDGRGYYNPVGIYIYYE